MKNGSLIFQYRHPFTESAVLKVFSACITIMWICLVYSCRTDVDYSMDPSDGLSFSKDTVSFDTVFTGIGSSSQSLMLYNSNSEAIRFYAQLAGGTHSPFTFTADGITGDRIDDLEIRSDDSLYCFVSVAITPDGSDDLKTVRDSVIFMLQSGLTQKVLLEACGQNVTVLHSVTFASDTTLMAGRPYLVYDTLSVREGAVLTIEPGVELCCHKGAVLKVSGTLRTAGSMESPVIIHGDRKDYLLPDIPYDLTAGTWGGILLDSCSYGNVIDHCVISGGEWGIRADTADIEQVKLTLTNSVIHNVGGNGLELNYCTSDILNSRITNAKGYCVSLLGGNNTFVFCTIAGFYPWSTSLEAVSVKNLSGTKVFPMPAAVFNSCIITGRSEDEMTGLVVDSLEGWPKDQVGNYRVMHSLLMSPDTLNTHYTDVVFEDVSRECYGSANFIHVAKGDFRYDFHLDSLSAARSLADTAMVRLYPYDMDGVERISGKADAGCYQYRDP